MSNRKTKLRTVKRHIKPSNDFPDFSNGAEFDALSDEDKEKVSQYYEKGRHLSEMRSLNARG